MSNNYGRKTAARRLADVTGHSYQRCLTAVDSRDLSALVPSPIAASADTIADVAAAGLVTDGEFPTPREAKVALLTATVAAVVRRHHPDAVDATVTFDDDEPPAGYLSNVMFDDGTELPGALGEPVSDDAFVWADTLTRALELAPGDHHIITLS